ncbi:MAG TPA: discoidin domain-containing protein, partial [Pyrinomonadaceae bacterium]|nr:discoidin domain-containing protein [Pyrinomonadaceae bacterium]
GLIFETKVGRGRLLVCAADIQHELDNRPAARQLRRSLLDYMASARFQPQAAVSVADMRGLLCDTLIMRKLGATAQAEGQAANAIDGDPNTFWQAGAQKQPARQTQTLTVSFPAPVSVSGLVLMSRQNHREHEGDIREYLIQVSADGREWREAARGELLSTFAPQQINFPQPIIVRQLKLTALSGFGPDKTAALAELAIIYAGPKLPEAGADALNYQRSKTATPDIDEGTVAPKQPTTPPPKRKPPRRRQRP